MTRKVALASGTFQTPKRHVTKGRRHSEADTAVPRNDNADNSKVHFSSSGSEDPPLGLAEGVLLLMMYRSIICTVSRLPLLYGNIRPTASLLWSDAIWWVSMVVQKAYCRTYVSG
ncbi:unnamed protein product, partial [Scytosiphon promiscuus]